MEEEHERSMRRRKGPCRQSPPPALRAAEQLAREDIDAEVIDLRAARSTLRRILDSVQEDRPSRHRARGILSMP
jgi:hypothetical protein